MSDTRQDAPPSPPPYPGGVVLPPAEWLEWMAVALGVTVQEVIRRLIYGPPPPPPPPPPPVQPWPPVYAGGETVAAATAPDAAAPVQYGTWTLTLTECHPCEGGGRRTAHQQWVTHWRQP